MAQQTILFLGPAGTVANEDIDVLDGVEFNKIESVRYLDISVPGGGIREIDAKGDGDAEVGHIRLQASGKVLRLGHATAQGDVLIICGPLAGEVQGYGDGT